MDEAFRAGFRELVKATRQPSVPNPGPGVLAMAELTKVLRSHAEVVQANTQALNVHSEALDRQSAAIRDAWRSHDETEGDAWKLGDIDDGGSTP